jgi:glycosyltransferase involved in cell wall biosynthesis
VKVLLVCDLYPPFAGGLEAHVQRLAGHLIRRGHEVVVVTVRHPTEPYDQRDVEVIGSDLLIGAVPGLYRTGRPFHPPWVDRRFRSTVRAAAARFRPDVIHAHGWSMFSAVSAAAGTGVPVVATLHDYGLLCPAKSLSCGGRRCVTTAGLCCLRCAGCPQGLLRRAGLASALRANVPRAVRGVSRLIAVSSCVADEHRRAGVGDPDLIRVIPNFVDLDDPAPGTAPAAGPVLFVGPPDPHKGRSVLERAFELDCLSTRELRLVGDAGARSRGNVVAVGRRAGAELWHEFRESSIVALPVVWMDPCPTVALEAMALGRPVVASATGGLLDIVQDGVTGVLVPPADPVRLAGALADLSADPRRMAAFGAAARARVREQFSADAVVPRIEATYREAGSSG